MSDLLFYIHRPFAWFMGKPGTGLIPAGVISLLLYVIYIGKGRVALPRRTAISFIVMIAVWLAYGIYETWLYFYWTRHQVGAPIRVDLLVIVPVLYIVTVIGFLVLALKKPKKQDPVPS